MKNMYCKFLELIFVDVIYKFLDLRMFVYFVFCIDGNGLSEIVVMFIFVEEIKVVIEVVVGVFRKLNFVCNEIKVVMLDKDFIEWEVFISCFLGVFLNICLFYILCLFWREIIYEKMGIMLVEWYWCLEVLIGLVYFKLLEVFDRYLYVLDNISLSVKEYIELNWIFIKD